MSEAVDTSRAPRRPVVRHELPGGLPLRTWVYRQLTSMRTALVLLGVLALLTLAGTLIAQAPAEVRADPRAYADWLDSVRPRYGGWTGVLDALGFFAIFSSIWFKAGMALLSASLIVCSVRNVPRLWRVATRPRMVMTDAFFERAPHRASLPTELEPGAALSAVRGAFRKHRFRTAIERHGDDVHVCADRFRWGPFGRIVAHLSFVVILLGAVLTTTGGFREEGFAVPIGDRKAVGNGTDLAVEAKSFSSTYYLSGEPRDYASEIVLYEGGRPVKRQEVRVNHPLRYEGVAVYQSFFGPAAVIEARGENGRALFDGGVPLEFGTDDGRHRVGSFSIPERGLDVFVVTPESGTFDRRIAPGQAQLEVYRSGSEKEPVAMRVVSQGEPQEIAGVELTFVRERQFTGLTVARDPGSSLIWIGSTLLVLGMCTVFFFPHRRVRAVVRRGRDGTEAAVAAIRRRDPAFAAQFEQLTEDIRRAVRPATRGKGAA